MNLLIGSILSLINYIALFTALALSVVSAFYSITGLTAIFSGAFYPIIIMGAVLEIGKVVTTSWLYRNWQTSGIVLKFVLIPIVTILTLISSMGIFGFLSRAHIEQTISIQNGQSESIQEIENSILVEKSTVTDIDLQISQIDNVVKKLVDSGKPLASLGVTDGQKKQRAALIARKDFISKNINEEQSHKLALELQLKRLEAEVGPIRYIANMFYTNADAAQLEIAVKWMILIIVVVFDPLALALLLAANHGLLKGKEKDMIHVHKNNILNVKLNSEA